MAKKVSIKKRTQSGGMIHLYGELVTYGPAPQVAVWTKHANYGYYNLDRFGGGVLTTASFKKMFGDS